MARRVIPASASIKTVCNPARAVKVAALAPAGPPPTMATSYIRVLLPGTMRPSLVQHATQPEASRRKYATRRVMTPPAKAGGFSEERLLAPTAASQATAQVSPCGHLSRLAPEGPIRALKRGTPCSPKD